MNRIRISSYQVFIAALVLLFSLGVHAQTIPVSQLVSAPDIDGSASDWAGVEAVDIPLRNHKLGGKANVPSVTVKAGLYADRVYILMQWEDGSEDNQHKPFVWDETKGKYVVGKQREDRLAIQFAMTGDYDANWLIGKEFTADTWHWKAARTNGIGLAQDKMTIVSKKKLKKSYKAKAADGSVIYIKRPSDKGGKLYKTIRYATKQGDVMPKYILQKSVTGSIADVKAKGVWRDGKWSLEMSRKLDTGHADDVVFQRGTAVKGGIALFDHSGDDDHSISDNLVFVF